MSSRYLRGRYELLRPLGGGGQGEVLEAIDHLHGRRVAIKIRHVPDPDGRERILREARVLFGLRPHENIALAREDFFVDDRYYLVMDWVEGTDLREMLAERGTLPLGETVAVLDQIASALDHLHAHDPPILHLDVKPSNVVFDPSGRAVLVDFGISGDSTAGTLDHRAPELLAGADLGPAADVYGLAVTAYRMLTGAVPQVGAWSDIEGAVGEQARRLREAFTKALSYDPGKRPRTASAFVDAIRPNATPTNLPSIPSTFVGRRSLATQVEDSLWAGPVVTLTGTGGAGKTRLALHVASRLLGRFPGGVWFVDLSATTDPMSLPAEVGLAIGGVEARAAGASAALEAAIGEEIVLLVLDNCEHLLEASAALVSTLTGGCPGLTVLATSRVTLGIPQEILVHVEGLSLPDGDSPDDLEGSEAGRLFRDRAVPARPDFAITSANATDLAELCRALDGLPLAIELAAARLSAFPPGELRKMLTGPEAASVLEGAIAWSHDLLSSHARVLLRRLSVFAGPFDLDASREVCGSGDLDAGDVLDVLLRLTAASLVETVAGDGVRYRLLETVRAFAAARLADAGEVEGTRERLVSWATTLTDQASVGMSGAERAEWTARLEADHDNIRAALGAAVAWPDDHAARIASAMAEFWSLRGYLTEGRRWLERAVEGRQRTATVSAALSASGGLARDQGDAAGAQDAFGRALDAARDVGGAAEELVALRGLSMLAADRGAHEEAEALFGRCLDVARSMGNEQQATSALHELGIVSIVRGHLDEARERLEGALASFTRLQSDQGTFQTRYALGSLEALEGNHAEAQSHLEAAVELARQLGSLSHEVRALVQLAVVSLSGDDLDTARTAIDRAGELAAELGEDFVQAGVHRVAADLAISEDDPGRAYEHLAACVDTFRTAERVVSLVWVLRGMGTAAIRRDRLHDARNHLSEALELATASSLDGMIVACRTGLAELAHAESCREDAVRELTDALRLAVGLGPGDLEPSALDDALELTARLCGSDARPADAEAGLRMLDAHPDLPRSRRA